MSTLLAWLAAALGAFLLSIVALVAFTPHDHKVELVVSWPSTPPTRIWQLLTQHADEPRWLTFFASVKRQPDDQGRPVWTYRDATGSFSATMMTILAVPERRYERILLREPGAGSDAWDVRWVIELEPVGSGTRMRFTEYRLDGWLRVLSPAANCREPASLPRAIRAQYGRGLGRPAPDRGRSNPLAGCKGTPGHRPPGTRALVVNGRARARAFNAQVRTRADCGSGVEEER